MSDLPAGYDTWLSTPPDEVGGGARECPDCDGTGEESSGPGATDCKTCNGDGFISRAHYEDLREERMAELNDEQGRI